MNKFKILLGATALAVAAVAIIACSKEKTAQQKITTIQQPTESKDYTLAEMAEAMSWEEGKAFFENQPIKDYTYMCEEVLNDCGFEEKSQQSPLYDIVWYWPKANGGCDEDYIGLCSVTKTDTTFRHSNARGFVADNKLVIIPTTDEDGFTADGYLAVGLPITVNNDSIVILQGIYAAYYDEVIGRYVAVAVDIESAN